MRVLASPQPPLTLVVLAAGLASRYGGHKQFAPVGPAGEALLDYGIFDALRAGFDRIVLVIRAALEAEFRRRIGPRWRDVDLRLVHQRPEAVGAGVIIPAERVKPWGTGHAVLAAEPELVGPFAVSNADDFYGADAYSSLATHLRGAGGARDEQALVGYRMADTLSPYGGVSRGLCVVDGDGRLRGLTEVLDVRAAHAAIVGRSADGASLTLAADAIASMNLWGFTPALLPRLRAGFGAFLAARGSAPHAEFQLSPAMHALVSDGSVVLRVLHTDERWMGMTYADDREAVAARLATLVADGRYPSPLAAPRRAERTDG